MRSATPQGPPWCEKAEPCGEGLEVELPHGERPQTEETLLRVKRHSWKWNLQYQPPNQCHLKPRWNLLKSLTNKTVRMVTISHQVLEWFSGSHTEPKQSVIASWNDLWYHHRSKNDVTWSFFRQKEEMNKGPSSRLRPQRHSSLILRQKVCTARKGLPDFFLTHPPRNH